MDYNDNKEVINTMLDMEYIPSILDEKINIEQYTKFPLAQLATLGVGFSELLNSKHTITQSINADGLYKCILPKGSIKLAQARDGTGALGNALGPDNKLVGHARWIEQGNITQVTTMPYNPAMFFMAVALMSMDKKLDCILDKQQEIIEFLEQKEKADLVGDLNTLYYVLNNYKYNWDNEKYKSNKHILVQDIKRCAMRSIKFHKEQTISKLQKQ